MMPHLIVFDISVQSHTHLIVFDISVQSHTHMICYIIPDIGRRRDEIHSWPRVRNKRLFYFGREKSLF